MRFQPRDGEILKAIYGNDGILPRRLIKSLFWPDSKNPRAMEIRLLKLKRAGYIDWPSEKQRREYPIPEPVCWLGPKGIEYITGEFGVKVVSPKSVNDYQLRNYHKELRDHGIRWLRSPRWSLLRHDLVISDIKFAIIEAISELPNFSMKNWMPDSAFRSDLDIVTYEVKSKDGEIKRIDKGICPDAYFEIVDEERRDKGQPYRIRFLLEVDMASYDNARFGREKALPGVAYIKSLAYRERFGQNTGRWLIITSGGERRRSSLKRQTKKDVGDDVNLFLFTSFDKITGQNLLSSPIWEQIGINHPLPLLK